MELGIAAENALTFIVPGALDQITGGYLFDRRIIDGLRAAGRTVWVCELPGAVFPAADEIALAAAEGVFAELPDGAAIVFDGLALPALERCLPAAAERQRVIAFVHHPLAIETGLSPADSRYLAGLERAFLPRLRGVLCPSMRTAEAMIEYGVPALRIAVTPPGTAKPAAPVPPRITGGRLRLLSVATVTPRKGHLLLIEALGRLTDRDWHLMCVGSLSRDPATVAALQSAIAAHGLRERVTLAGEWQPDAIGRAYAQADLFVLPSYHEGYGMAYAEAMSFGLPIVATSAGAIPDTVPETAGILVPPGDVSALATALATLLDDCALRARMAAGATAAGGLLPDWDRAVEGWAQAADCLLDGVAIQSRLMPGPLTMSPSGVERRRSVGDNWAGDCRAVGAL